MTRVSAVAARCPRVFSVTMAYDAFRICIGMPTKNHPPKDVMRWMSLMLKSDGSKTEPGEPHGT